MSLLFPGSRIGEWCIVGSSTCISRDEEVSSCTRRQGRWQYGEVVVNRTMPQKLVHDIQMGVPSKVDPSMPTFNGSAWGKGDAEQPKGLPPAAAAAGGGHGHADRGCRGKGLFVFLGKWLFFNTQIEIQLLLLVLIWIFAYQKQGVVMGLLLPILLVVCVMVSVVWCRRCSMCWAAVASGCLEMPH
jgi:hypothetical protein